MAEQKFRDFAVQRFAEAGMPDHEKSTLDLETEATLREYDRSQEVIAERRKQVPAGQRGRLFPAKMTVRPAGGFSRVLDEDGNWIEGATEVNSGNLWILRRIRDGELELVASEEAKAALAEAKEKVRAAAQAEYEAAKQKAQQQGQPEPPPPPPPEPEPVPEVEDEQPEQPPQ